ncbi:MAG: GGDEF domain-containing protein [Actinobacteria bacterium]|nr:GGDEF domain-containing protein [Actinomycetota bacterium]
MTREKHREAVELTLTEDVIYFFQKLNHDIEEFITNSLESSADVEKWSALSSSFKPLKCWEIKGCTKKDCLVYGSKDNRCWLQVGTLCGGKVQGEFAKKYKTCYECDVLRLISLEPARALYENINTLTFHFHNKTLKLSELAIKDQLTNLYNRHFFNEIIERETAKAERRKESLSFIMIDVDNFKKINDTLGHFTGDKLLVEAANIIKNTVRKSDIVFRYGGDEFLIILTNTGSDTRTNMVQRISDAVDKWNKDKMETFGCKLSFSMGCSTYKKGQNVLETLREADEMMYKNKNIS